MRTAVIAVLMAAALAGYADASGYTGYVITERGNAFEIGGTGQGDSGGGGSGGDADSAALATVGGFGTSIQIERVEPEGRMIFGTDLVGTAIDARPYTHVGTSNLYTALIRPGDNSTALPFDGFYGTYEYGSGTLTKSEAGIDNILTYDSSRTVFGNATASAGEDGIVVTGHGRAIMRLDLSAYGDVVVQSEIPDGSAARLADSPYDLTSLGGPGLNAVRTTEWFCDPPHFRHRSYVCSAVGPGVYEEPRAAAKGHCPHPSLHVSLCHRETFMRLSEPPGPDGVAKFRIGTSGSQHGMNILAGSVEDSDKTGTLSYDVEARRAGGTLRTYSQTVEAQLNHTPHSSGYAQITGSATSTPEPWNTGNVVCGPRPGFCRTVTTTHTPTNPEYTVYDTLPVRLHTRLVDGAQMVDVSQNPQYLVVDLHQGQTVTIGAATLTDVSGTDWTQRLPDGRYITDNLLIQDGIHVESPYDLRTVAFTFIDARPGEQWFCDPPRFRDPVHSCVAIGPGVYQEPVAAAKGYCPHSSLHVLKCHRQTFTPVGSGFLIHDETSHIDDVNHSVLVGSMNGTVISEYEESVTFGSHRHQPPIYPDLRHGDRSSEHVASITMAAEPQLTRHHTGFRMTDGGEDAYLQARDRQITDQVSGEYHEHRTGHPLGRYLPRDSHDASAHDGSGQVRLRVWDTMPVKPDTDGYSGNRYVIVDDIRKASPLLHFEGLPANTVYEIRAGGETLQVGRTDQSGRASTHVVPHNLGDAGVLYLYDGSLQYHGDHSRMILMDGYNGHAMEVDATPGLVYVPPAMQRISFSVPTDVDHVSVDSVGFGYLESEYGEGESVFIPVLTPSEAINIRVNGTDAKVLVKNIPTPDTVILKPRTSVSAEFSTDGTAPAIAETTAGTFAIATKSGTMNIHASGIVSGTGRTTTNLQYTGGFEVEETCNTRQERYNRFAGAWSSKVTSITDEPEHELGDRSTDSRAWWCAGDHGCRFDYRTSCTVTGIEPVSQEALSRINPNVDTGGLYVSTLAVDMLVHRNGEPADMLLADGSTVQVMRIFEGHPTEVAEVVGASTEAGGLSSTRMMEVAYRTLPFAGSASTEVESGDHVEVELVASLAFEAPPSPHLRNKSYASVTMTMQGGLLTVGTS